MKDSKTVLVVEDNEALNKAISFKLKNRGYKVKPVFTAEEAIKILESDGIDFVWLDLLLPGMNGLEFLKYLRGNPRLKDEKVAIVSVSGSEKTREKANSLGVVDFIVKSEYKLNDIISRFEPKI
jgi:CheY-like chemotaxis protein